MLGRRGSQGCNPVTGAVIGEVAVGAERGRIALRWVFTAEARRRGEVVAETGGNIWLAILMLPTYHARRFYSPIFGLPSYDLVILSTGTSRSSRMGLSGW